jgi:LDH2 family malate/lactate/ureidoglycolate dehydrogenase
LSRVSFPSGLFNNSNSWGNLIIAIDPSILVDRSEFSKRVTALLERVKAAQPIDATKPVMLPGERSSTQAERVRREGELSINVHLLRGLEEAAGVRAPSAKL